MKITISPSEEQDMQKPQQAFTSSTCEHPDDLADLAMVVEMSIRALVGYGFSRKAIVNEMHKVEE